MTSERYRRIYAAVRQIPAGRVATYGQIAALAGMPRQARLVGYALHALPDGSAVPWHRVVNREGRLVVGGGVPGATLRQRLRLEREDVGFVRDRVPLARFRWGARPAAKGPGDARPAARSPSSSSSRADRR